MNAEKSKVKMQNAKLWSHFAGFIFMVEVSARELALKKCTGQL